jgi:hypothetical protein
MGFGDHSVPAKPCYDYRVPVQTRQDTLRLRVLTRLNWRPSTCGEARLFGDVKVLKRSVPLRPQTGISHLTSALRAAEAVPNRVQVI